MVICSGGSEAWTELPTCIPPCNLASFWAVSPTVARLSLRLHGHTMDSAEPRAQGPSTQAQSGQISAIMELGPKNITYTAFQPQVHSGTISGPSGKYAVSSPYWYQLTTKFPVQAPRVAEDQLHGFHLLPETIVYPSMCDHST